MAQINFGPSLTPNASSVNFFQQAPDAAVDVNALQRQRAMAQLLAQRGIQSPEGQMVSGHYVAPGALSYLNQLASALAGGYLNRDSDAKEQSLAQALIAKRQKDSTDFMSALNGTPAQPGREIAPLTPNDDEGNPMPSAQAPASSAVPGDVNKAIAIALQSQNPQLAGMAPELMKRQMDAAELQSALQAAGLGNGAVGGAGGGLIGGAPGSAGGLPEGVNPQAAALVLSRNAQANKLGTMFQEASKPVNVAEGGTVYVPGRGAVFTAPKTEAGISSNGAPVPGFQEAQARRERLIAEGKAGVESDNTMVTIKGPDNREYTMTRSQAKQLVGGGPAPTPGYANESQMKATASGNMGQDPAALQRELTALRRDLEKVPDASSKRLIQDEIDRLEGQGKTYGTGGGRGVQGGAPAMPGLAGPDPTVNATNAALAAKTPEVLLESRNAAKAAQDELMSVAEARTTAKSGIYAGSGADTKLATAKFINSWVPFVNIDPEKVANTDYVKSVMGSGLLKQAKALGTNPTDADAKRLDDILGTINKDPKALDRLLDWRETMARRALDGHVQMMQGATAGGVRSPIDLNVQTPTPNANGGFRIIGVQ